TLGSSTGTARKLGKAARVVSFTSRERNSGGSRKTHRWCSMLVFSDSEWKVGLKVGGDRGASHPKRRSFDCQSQIHEFLQVALRYWESYSRIDSSYLIGCPRECNQPAVARLPGLWRAPHGK